MRRYLLFLLLFCMHCIARGQTIYDYRYWFDNDYSLVMEGRSLSGSWQFQADLTGLSESLHAIHIQVTDTTGVMSSPVTRFFVKMRDINVKEGRYWFDNDVTTQRKSDAVQGIMDIDVTALREGFHTFHYQVMGTDGYYSLPVTRSFYKVLVPENSYYRCWVDEDYSTLARGKFTGFPILVDITSISEGYHQLRVQIDGSTPSSPVSHSFVKIPQTEGVDYLTCLCSVDDNLFRQEQVASTGGIINWNFDVSELSQGFHRMQVQVVTPSGAATSTYDAFFLRTTLTEEINDMKCVYCVDGAEFYTEAGRMSNGAFHCDLDVSTLTDGLHRLSYYLTNGKGVSTKMSTQFFLKTPVGGNGIMQYQYWVNDRDDQKHVVTLDQRTNPFSLVKLLPVETQPIRSSNFQFVMKNSSPLIYARNEFHIRFYDTSGRMVEETKEYYDEQMSAAVEPVGELQATQTFNKVANNDIRWYTMQSAPGDTVAFKLSQAGTVQVFAPSGAEVFKTSESASVNWGGIHTWEDGTYYLAVHDVTGSQSTMKLEYMHMDKYDIVDWDVHRVGNGGCSTITFKGNGFRDLYAVDLVIAPSDTIHSIYVSHDSDAETAVIFDFTDATLGEYNAVFHFTEEAKPVANVVTVEEAIDIELATDVSFPSSFLRGTSTTYTIKITNKGNMMAYRVPFYLYISSLTEKSISKISIEGLKLPSLFDIVNNDSLPESERIQLANYSKEIGEDHYFVEQKVKDEVSTDSICVKSGYFCTDISPCSIKTITITIESKDNVECWVTMPDEWPSIAYDLDSKKIKSRRHRAESNSDSWYCCYHERIECLVNGFATATGMGGPILSCLGNFASISVNWATDHFCGKEDNSGEKNAWDKIHSWMDGLSKAGVLTCWNPLGKITGTIQVIMHPVIVTDCITAFAKKKPNCPPKPPTGGSSTPRPPSDPNDIFGPLSEAGSKFIADSVARVNYTIEFENDTTFAEAAAHTIVIKDTLDSRYFDLNVFMPKGVRIGGHEVFLDEADIVTSNDKTTFVKTIDMRPEINAIAQVEGEYNQKNGIAQWTFTSLDPMTMEPTDDLMQGILPVNYNGTSGIGEVMFEIGVKQGKADGTEIKNRAGIVFDYEEAILTPTWVNTVDAVPPMSRVEYTSTEKADTVTLHLAGEDARSGVWRYTVYVQDGKNAPWRELGVTDSCAFDFEYAEGIDYGFCVLATDSAGNVERKELAREAELRNFIAGDANSDGVVDTKDAVLVISYYLGLPGTYLNMSAADIVEDGVIDTKDAVAIIDKYLNTSTSPKTKKNRKRIRVL